MTHHRQLIDPGDDRLTPNEKRALRRLAAEIERRARGALPLLPDSYRRELDRLFGPTDGDR